MSECEFGFDDDIHPAQSNGLECLGTNNFQQKHIAKLKDPMQVTYPPR